MDPNQPVGIEQSSTGLPLITTHDVLYWYKYNLVYFTTLVLFMVLISDTIKQVYIVYFSVVNMLVIVSSKLVV